MSDELRDGEAALVCPNCGRRIRTETCEACAMPDEFVWAPVHVISSEENDDEIVLSTPTPACDFCLDSRIVWEYPCARFTIDEIQFGSDDNWLACERCAELIEQKLLPALTLRSVRSWTIREGAPTGEQIDGVGQIQQGFFDHRSGPRFRYEP